MKKENIRRLIVPILFLVAFLLWTVLILFVDVKSIGPKGSYVGFASFNEFFHDFTGVDMTLYNVTDWLGLVPIIIMMSFAFIGLFQLIKRKKLKLVDYSILVLGGFYFVVLLLFLFFEVFVVNYRPVLINGSLEASYPSSTTMLIMCIVPTTILQLNDRVKNYRIKLILCLFLTLFAVFMIIARTLSGVHWITDIIGAILISTSLVTFYRFFIKMKTTPKS